MHYDLKSSLRESSRAPILSLPFCPGFLPAAVLGETLAPLACEGPSKGESSGTRLAPAIRDSPSHECEWPRWKPLNVIGTLISIRETLPYCRQSC